MEYSPLSREFFKKDRNMLIGELTKRTGLSKDTIRFYEKQGLIQVGRKERRDNNYKEYSEAIVQKLLSVKMIKSLGFTLNETSTLLGMIDANEATCSNVAFKIQEKVTLLDEKIRELISVRSMLLSGLQKCEGSSCDPERPDSNCSIITTPKS